MKIDNHNLDNALFTALKEDLRSVEVTGAQAFMPGSFMSMSSPWIAAAISDTEYDLKIPAVEPPPTSASAATKSSGRASRLSETARPSG